MNIIDKTPIGYFHEEQLRNEDWEQVLGLPNTWVSSLGRVWHSYNCNQTKCATISIGSANKDGYMQVQIEGIVYEWKRIPKPTT